MNSLSPVQAKISLEWSCGDQDTLAEIEYCPNQLLDELLVSTSVCCA